MCSMYHEPVSEGLSVGQYQGMINYYGPTVRQYYPLNYSGQASSGGGTVANYQTYYMSGSFDAASVDYYCANYDAGLLISDYAAVTDADNLPFGLWEFGVNESGQTQTQGTNFYTYLQSFFTGRLSAGKGNGYISHYTASPPAKLSDPAFATGDYQISLYQSLYDVFGVSFTAEQSGNLWTTPSGWSNIGNIGNGTGTLAFDAFHQENLRAELVSAIGQYSTAQGVAGWAGILATLAASA
jgi:hypothetical protein